jgi:hypothetical protein
MLETAIEDCRAAMANDDEKQTRIAIRDIGFLAFACDQHYVRLVSTPASITH